MSATIFQLNTFRKAPPRYAMQDSLGPDDRIVFHGTSSSFEAFDLAFCGSGGDNNSHWGVHLAETPFDAADYAAVKAARIGGEAQVLVVRATTRNPVSGLSYYEFFGYDENGDSVVAPEAFARRRAELIAAGHDSIDYEDGEQTIVVSFDPDLLEVVARLTPEQALQVATRIAALPDPEDDAARLLIVNQTLDPDAREQTSPPRVMP